MPLLEVQDLTTRIQLSEGVLTPVNGVDLTIDEGEVVGLVGESGCGKSMTALSIVRLLPNEADIVGGKILIGGVDVTAAPESVLVEMRGREVSFVFQDPMTFLNPVMRVANQIGETLVLRQKLEKRAARRVAQDILASVGIGDVKRVASSYPHQLSGGMRQRVSIAIALASRPRLLIADEPFTAVDLSVQDQLIQLLKEKQVELELSILLITHDLAVTAELCDRLYVMYAGEIVETGEVKEIYEAPKHPYTQALIRCAQAHDNEGAEIPFIPGSVPSLLNPPPGCRFHPRCPHAFEPCSNLIPRKTKTGERAEVRCWLHAS